MAIRAPDGAKNGNIWPKITKNAYFGPILAVFGPKILIFTGESKSFGTHIKDKPPRHLVRIVFWFGPKLPKMHILGKIWPFLGNKS